MSYKTEHFDNEHDWLNARGIGGSSASAIVGLNPWEDKWQLYDRLVKGNKQHKKNALLDYGHKIEPTIRRMFALHHPQLKVIAPKNYEMFRREDKPYMTATVDGLLRDKDGRLGILEIKSHEVRRASDMDEWLDGRIPPNYLIQIMHYLAVIEDAMFVELVVNHRVYEFDGVTSTTIRSEFHYKHLERSEPEVQKQLAWLEHEETTFYESYVRLGKRPPAPKSVATLF